MRSSGPDETCLIELMALSVLHKRGELPIVPHIKQVIVDFESNRILIAMKLYDYSLLDFFKQQAMPAFDIVSIAQTMTYVVSIAHSMGIVHLDLKPANMLVNRDSVLVVSDWGLSRLVGETGEQITYGNKFVTVSHRPPELMLGWGRVGTYTDVWSVGCIIAELLDGRTVCSDWSEWSALVRITRTIGRPDEDFCVKYQDRLCFLRGDPDDKIILPDIPRRKASESYEKNIQSYADSMGGEQGRRMARSLAAAFDMAIQWDWSARASALRINKALFSYESDS